MKCLVIVECFTNSGCIGKSDMHIVDATNKLVEIFTRIQSGDYDNSDLEMDWLNIETINYATEEIEKKSNIIYKCFDAKIIGAF